MHCDWAPTITPAATEWRYPICNWWSPISDPFLPPLPGLLAVLTQNSWSLPSSVSPSAPSLSPSPRF